MTLLITQNLSSRDFSSRNFAERHPNLAADIAHLGDWIGGVINDWAKRYIAHRERQIALSALRRFSDQDLNRIGITRAELDATIAGLAPGAASIRRLRDVADARARITARAA